MAKNKNIDVNAALKDLGLTTEKTDDSTLLDKLGASVGINSCSYNANTKTKG